MGRSAYWNSRVAGVASRHWATRTAVRVPGHDPRLALGSAHRTDPPERWALPRFLFPGSLLRILTGTVAAVGYLMLALAGVLLVAAVVLLRVSRGRRGDTPASAEHSDPEP